MYTVYYNDTLIYSSSSPMKEIRLVDPELAMGDSVAGSFKFTMLPNNPGYNVVQRMIGLIKVKRDGSTIWTGRVINQVDDFWKRRTCTCEGALAFLNDSNQDMRVYSDLDMLNFLARLLQIHNAKVPANRQIQLGAVTVTDMNDSHLYKVNYGSTWQEMQSNIIDRLGGHVRIRYDGDIPKLDYLATYPNSASQEINFGQNLLDFTRNWDLSNLVTVIIPRGKQLDQDDEYGQRDYVTVESVNNGSKYVKNTTAFNTYGRIEKTVDFSDVEEPSQLLTLAQNYISAQQFDSVVLDISAIDLHILTGSVVAFNLLDQVRCISRPHGMDTWFPVTEMTIPLEHPENTRYTMGVSQNSSMSSKAAADSQGFINQIQNFLSIHNLLDQAKANATEIINSATTGYVNIITENGSSQALIISDHPEIENATRLWRFNVNGLGYLDKTKGQNYQTAITMDGTIVADFIKTGTLSDGVGKNYWNLSTGEFKLQWNTQLLDAYGLNTGKSLIDIYSLANTANTKTVGGKNYLNGTADWNGWRKAGGWSFDSNYAACNAKSSVNDWNDAIKSPSKGLLYSKLRGYKICASFEGYSGDTWGTISTTNALYLTFSLCDAQGTRKAHLDKMLYLSTAKQRRYVSFDLVDSAFTRDNYAGSLVNLYLEVWIINRSKHYVRIDHIMLERGTTPTDWNTSDGDKVEENKAVAESLAESAQTNAIAAAKSDATAKANAAKNEAIATAGQKDSNVLALAKTFTNNISAQDRSYTDTQRRALDASLNQAGVLKRLTNNYQSQGIYLSQGQLYINASYIRTGTLDAGIVKTGIITDNQGLNKWNLVTGYFETKNLVAKNANITGVLQAGSGNVSEIKNGTVRFFNGNKNAVTIDGALRFTDGNYGGHITFDKYLVLRGPNLATSTSTTKNGYLGYTGRVVLGPFKHADGSSGPIIIDVINGLVVGIQGCTGYCNKYDGESGVLSSRW